MRIVCTNRIMHINGVPHSFPFPEVRVIDLEKGTPIRHCRAACDETGEWEAFVMKGSIHATTPKGFPKKTRGRSRLLITVMPCPVTGCVACSMNRAVLDCRLPGHPEWLCGLFATTDDGLVTVRAYRADGLVVHGTGETRDEAMRRLVECLPRTRTC